MLKGVDHPMGDHLELAFFGKRLFSVLLLWDESCIGILGLIHCVLDHHDPFLSD
jgi:hypothetical protein